MFSKDAFPQHPDFELTHSHKNETETLGIETPNEFTEKGLVSNEAIARKLQEQGFLFTGKREALSGGFFGPIYLLEATNTQGNNVRITEKAFSSSRSKEAKHFSLYKHTAKDFSEASLDVRPRLAEVDLETGELKNVLVDWIFNEEKALKDLHDIPGIPQCFGAVYEGGKGSILTQYIDGPDLALSQEQLVDEDRVNRIFDRFRDTYQAAAERGYIYNHPGGATTMLDAQLEQPYLIDWYNHATGDITEDGPARKKYLEGLEEIEYERNAWLESLRQKESS